MKITLILVMVVVCNSCIATDQLSELLIYRGDTLEIEGEPLEPYLLKIEAEKHSLTKLTGECGTNLWRGYVGLWKVEDGKLFLVDVYLCGRMTKSIKVLLFNKNSEEIFADWFSGKLLVGNGRILKGRKSLCYEHEIVIRLDKGVVTTDEQFLNGIKANDQRFARNVDEIRREIYKNLDWEVLPEISKNKELLLTIKVNELGIIEFTVHGQIGEVYRKQIIGIMESFPKVQVLFCRGEPIVETWKVPIIFSNESRRKYTR